MTTELATKADLNQLCCEIASTRESLKQEMQLLLSSMTIRFGTMLALGLGLLFAALKLT